MLNRKERIERKKVRAGSETRPLRSLCKKFFGSFSRLTTNLYVRDLISSVFWLAIAIFFSIEGFTHLKLGTLHQPGPGFFPFWGGVVLGLLSLVLLLTHSRTETGSRCPASNRRSFSSRLEQF